MQPRSAARVTRPTAADRIPLHNGDHMDQKTFHALYKQTPAEFKAELIGGIVYVASPVTARHGRPHGRVIHWLSIYSGATPGTDVLDNTTNILDEESEPQPDGCLLIQPEYGGQTSEDEDGYIVGAAELVAEVAYSTAAIDLHRKKKDYEEAGVREYVVVLAESQSAVWYTRGRRGFVELKPGADGILRSRVFPGLWLDPAMIFAKTVKQLNSVTNQGLASPEHAAFVAKLEKAANKRKPKPNGSQSPHER
jgi:Uma2 family endonuclease